MRNLKRIINESVDRALNEINGGQGFGGGNGRPNVPNGPSPTIKRSINNILNKLEMINSECGNILEYADWDRKELGNLTYETLDNIQDQIIKFYKTFKESLGNNSGDFYLDDDDDW